MFRKVNYLFLQILGEYSHIQKEILPHETVRELQSACMLPKISSIAATWILSAMLKIGLRNRQAIADVEISELRQRIRTENMESVQVQNLINLIHVSSGKIILPHLLNMKRLQEL